MILQLGISFLLGAITPTVYSKYCKKLLIIKKRHIHHTTYGLFSSLSSIPLLLKDISLGIYMLGFGLGLIINHRIAEKNFKLITRD